MSVLSPSATLAGSSKRTTSIYYMWKVLNSQGLGTALHKETPWGFVESASDPAPGRRMSHSARWLSGDGNVESDCLRGCSKTHRRNVLPDPAVCRSKPRSPLLLTLQKLFARLGAPSTFLAPPDTLRLLLWAPLLCVMLWRVLKAPWHLGDEILPRYSSLNVLVPRNRPVLSPSCLRYWHGQSGGDTENSPALIRHARLSSDAEYVDGRRAGESVKIAGLVRSIRKQKNVAFARIGDGSTLANVQAVFPDPQLAKDITNGAYVALVGKWVPSKGAGQSHELQVEKIETLGDGNTSENPIQKQSMSTDFLRTVPHLRMRTAFHSLVNRARSQLISAITSHFANRPDPVYQVLPPLITSSDCEGAGEAFTIAPQSHEQLPGAASSTSKGQEKLYFREPKYLTVSSQLHLEAHAAEQGDVFAFSPTFRAEESDTPRHLSEFYMLEVEHRHVAFKELLSDVQSLVTYLAQSLREHRTGKELVEYYTDQKHRSTDADFVDLQDRWDRLSGRWHDVDYTSAMSSLMKAYESSGGKLFVHRPQWKQGLQLEHERWIVENLAEGKPVFVTHYPKDVKPFYMLPSSAMAPQRDMPRSELGRDTVACFDLLLPFGYCEVVGGSLREHRLEHLIQSMRQKGLVKRTELSNGDNGDGYPFLEKGETLGNMRWYADLRRFGSSPHGGYGLGFDRLLAYMTGVNNLREVVPFPRTWGRADC